MATPVCSVALRQPDGTIMEERAEGKGVHSESTFVFIRKLLDRAKTDVADLGAVVLSGGPGSYTGLRVGGSAVKGLLFQLDVPLFTYNTLAGIAMGYVSAENRGGSGDRHGADGPEQVVADGSRSIVVDAVIDARRNHLYHQAWRFGFEQGGKAPVRMEPEEEVAIRELKELLKRWRSGRTFAGTGTGRLSALAGTHDLDTEGLVPFSGTGTVSAAAVFGCLEVETEPEAWRRVIRKADPATFEPEYYTGI